MSFLLILDDIIGMQLCIFINQPWSDHSNKQRNLHCGVVLITFRIIGGGLIVNIFSNTIKFTLKIGKIAKGATNKVKS